MLNRQIIFNLLLLIISSQVFSQPNYIKPEGKIQKRVLHLLDDSPKENMALFAPKLPLGLIIYEAVTTGRKGITIKAYSDSGFTKIMKSADILKLGTSEETVSYAPDPDDPDFLVDTVVLNVFEPRNISKFIILEDSLIDLTGNPAFIIKAIAPVFKPVINGFAVQEEPMFWVKMDDLLPILSKEIIISSLNTTGKLTFADFLINHIYKYGFWAD